MKIVSTGSALNSREFYEKKKKRRRLELILLAIASVLILVGLIYFSRQEKFLVTDVVILGENVVDKDQMTQAVEESLAGYYLWLVPRKSTLLYPRRTIEESLVGNFPRLKSVDLNLEDNELLIAVEDRTPYALYCPNISLPASAGDCFFLDEDGLIFAIAPSFTGAVYFIYTTEEPIENPIGKKILATEGFKSIKEFIETLVGLSIYPVALEISSDEYSLSLANHARIIWRRESDFITIRSNLEAFLSNDTIRAQSNFLDKILHLDLRTENKVFYKFK